MGAGRFLTMFHGRTNAIASFGLLGLVAGGSVVAMLLTDGSASGQATPSPSPSATVTTAASPSPVTSPTSVPPTPTVAPPPRSTAGDVVKADPVRVKTGDGDCLNVRPVAGTKFEAEPFTCVPEGTLLWLSGPAQEVDGYTWRYALGAGWIAVQYTEPATAPKLRLPAQTALTVWQRDSKNDARGGGVTVARIDAASGKVLSSVRITDGWTADPIISPSGTFAAVTTNDGLRIVRVDNGEVKLLKGLNGVQWSKRDNLLVREPNTARASWYNSETGELTPVTREGEREDGMVWAADGGSVYTCIDKKLVRVFLDGRREEISYFPANVSLWNATPSPDGRSLLTGGGTVAIKIVDLLDGSVREFKLAEQRPINGGCGGGWSMIAGWLGNSRIYYHERYSLRKEDGVTIGDPTSGRRTILPFFNVQHLRNAGDGLLVFSTWAPGSDGETAVLFLIDSATGENWPLFAGSGATFAGAEVVSETSFGGV